MNSENVKSLFTLFSGEEYSSNFAPFLEISTIQVKKMLVEDADEDDSRLDFLCAALANYRYRLAEFSADRSEYTYAGKMLGSSVGKLLNFSESLLKDYFHLCRDLINGSDFVFMSTPGGDEQGGICRK